MATLTEAARHQRRRRRRQYPAWTLVVLDILMTGLVLCVFALFHHVIPRIRQEIEGPPVPIADFRPQADEPVRNMEEPGAQTPEPELPVGFGEPEEAPPEAPRPEGQEPETPEEPQGPLTWRQKFAEHFTDTVVVSENSYTSPNVSVTVTRHETELESGPAVYYVADIYIADIECFISGMPENGIYGRPGEISVSNEAVVAVNGDFAPIRVGRYIRNGRLYDGGQNFVDICVLYYDGTVEIYGPGEYTEEEIYARGPYQLWNFGPELLEADGTARPEIPQEKSVIGRHPRTGFGYYEPGHYCFVVVEGRQTDSNGARMEGFAAIFEELGCDKAYNFDGGDSSVMTFMGEVHTRLSGDRALCDMLAIRDLPVPAGGEKEEP